jgi:hypothetical protein
MGWLCNTDYSLALLDGKPDIAESILKKFAEVNFSWGKKVLHNMDPSIFPVNWCVTDYEKEINNVKLWLESLNIPTVRDWNKPLDVSFKPKYANNICNIPKFLQGDSDGIHFARYSAQHLENKDGRFWLIYDPERFTWPEANRRNMLTRMFQEAFGGKEGKVQISGRAHLGVMNWFQGFITNVGNEARELLHRTLDLNTYKTYNISFLELGPETWNIREKRRKSWEKTVYQELGSATLENGVRVDLRLNIEKEGYIVYLDFPDDEDMIRFQETELYKLTEWHSGAE